MKSQSIRYTHMRPQIPGSGLVAGLLQRACACGHTGGGECAECQKKQAGESSGGGSLWRRASAPGSPNIAPPIVHDVLRSPGQPLDTATRQFFEPRFGQDFSQVRVHTGQTSGSEPSVREQVNATGCSRFLHRDQHSLKTAACERLPTQELAPVIELRHWPRDVQASQAQSPPRYVEGQRSEPLGKVRCDVHAHPDDKLRVIPGDKFRTVGNGQIEIEIDPSLKNKPCLLEAAGVHEQQHVKNNSESCRNFKRCVDEHTSRFLKIGTPKISFEDFENCARDHNFGLVKGCVEDERGAYEVSLNKARELLKKKECGKEKAELQQNVEFWEKIKEHAPNCKEESERHYHNVRVDRSTVNP